jgi:hypothetical protein
MDRAPIDFARSNAAQSSSSATSCSATVAEENSFPLYVPRFATATPCALLA